MAAKNSDLGRLEEENRRLRSAVEELSIINDISTAINSTLSLEKIIELIVQRCIKHLRVEQGTVTLLESGGGEDQFRTMMRRADRSSGYMPLHLDTQITGWMLVNKKPLVIDDLETDERFRTFESDGPLFRTLLCVPLILKGRIIGSLNVFNKRGGAHFTEADTRLLSIIASQSSQVIENARLYEEEQSLKRMREELQAAYNIQIGLLPREFPAIEGYDVAGRSIPAASVGGDYFDLIRLGDGRLFFCLGDISGKGMPAALLMSNMLATLRGQDLDAFPPAKILQRSNHQMYRSTDPERFSTLFLGILDPAAHLIRYGNAGHNHPVLVRGDGSVERLQTGDLVLGALDDLSFHEDGASLGRGDVLFVFSDGISEAINVEDEEFGEERICRLIADHRHEGAQRIVDEMVVAVGAHACEMPQRDDVTMVVVKRL